MITPTPSVRQHDVARIDRVDEPAIACMLARAFADDPVVAWSLGDDARQQARATEHFSVILELYRHKGHSFADRRGRCASLWAPPTDPGVRASQLLRLLPRLARLYRHRLPLILAGLVRVERLRPAAPHFYLAYLGTDPDHQGEGLGAAALTPILDRCDRDGLPAYLEASKPALVPFYRRYGFEVVREIRLPAGPTVWSMWREPQRPDVS